ncbi:MAG: hypothetical protein Q8Q09_17095 [Deltaproteobacteria bacterium]|nr:hypothetical protein [Deltaproteobacteria bacterium]
MDAQTRMENAMLLYRPIGLEELLLVLASGMKAFPPRLPEQPIFYPVTNEGYAAQIARDWNTKSDSLAGYVTRFSVSDSYASTLPVKTVGAREHQELWVPAEKLEDFNKEIEGQITVIDAFFGEGFRGSLPKAFALKDKDAVAQLVALNEIHRDSLMDFHREIAANQDAVFVHFPLWKRRSFVVEGVTDAERRTLLNAIRKAWSEVSSTMPLSDI